MRGLKYIKKRFEIDEIEREDMEWLINKVEKLDTQYKNLLNAIHKTVEDNEKL